MNTRLVRGVAPVTLLLVAGLAGPAMAEVIVGTADGDRLVGTAHADTIRGLKGTDTIFGKGGRDELYGGAGADRVYGGPAGDLVDSGNDNKRDRLRTGRGNDRIGAQLGDRVHAGKGDDRILVRPGEWRMTEVWCGLGDDHVAGVTNPWLFLGHGCEHVD